MSLELRLVLVSEAFINNIKKKHTRSYTIHQLKPVVLA